MKDRTDADILRESVHRPYLFAILLDRYHDAFLRKAIRILRHREDAEDVVQETFVKLYRNADAFEERPGASFSSWAYKILVNTACTKYQKKKREQECRADVPPERYELLPDTARVFEDSERREYVASVLRRMPHPLSRALRMHFIEGKSQREIAEYEGTSVSAIKTRIHRAKQHFRRIDEAFV